jgi:hypothetical protein
VVTDVPTDKAKTKQSKWITFKLLREYYVMMENNKNVKAKKVE